MTETERNDWIRRLDGLLAEDATASDWSALLGELGFPPGTSPSVFEALTQGRWRSADDPRSYLKTVARREHEKDSRQADDNLVLPSLSSPSGETSLSEALGAISYAAESSEAVQGTDGVWRPGMANKDLLADDEGFEIFSYRHRLVAKIPSELRHAFKPPESLKQSFEEVGWNVDDLQHPHFDQIDWLEWAQRAGLDDLEIEVLKYRLQGISRERAVSNQQTEAERLGLQAAWKRFARSGLKRLEEYAKNNRRKMSRNVSGRTLDY